MLVLFPQNKEEKESDGSKKDESNSSKGEKDDVYPNLWAKMMAAKDELNLAGVLNVLDGVVDCPNRIVVRKKLNNSHIPLALQICCDIDIEEC